MSRSLFVGCIVLVGVAAAGFAVLDLSPESDPATPAAEPAAINAQRATIVEPGEAEVGPLEKAGRVADDLIEKAGLSAGSVGEITEKAKEIGEKAAEKAGLSAGSVEEITEKAKAIGEKAAEKAEVVVEKVKETATKAIVKAEELADDGKEAAKEAAGDLGETINTGK